MTPLQRERRNVPVVCVGRERRPVVAVAVVEAKPPGLPEVEPQHESCHDQRVHPALGDEAAIDELAILVPVSAATVGGAQVELQVRGHRARPAEHRSMTYRRLAVELAAALEVATIVHLDFVAELHASGTERELVADL